MLNTGRQVTNPAGGPLLARLDLWRREIAVQLGAVAGDRFHQMMLDTWCTTMTWIEDRVFVITGDIPAMWLRDSSAQVWPFLRLIDLADVKRTLVGVIRQQWRLIELDPYANAFNATQSGAHFDAMDLDLDDGVWERKYEIDSLAFAVRLAHDVWQLTGDGSHLDATVHAGFRTVVDLWRREQHHFELSDYAHIRESEPQDTLGADGRGTPVGYTGMTWSGFRPSDDACVYGYNIPAQLMAAEALRLIGECADFWHDDELKADAALLRQQITAGVQEFGVIDGAYAYEVDGLGNALSMDDANMPSLLSLPLISGIRPTDELYRATRRQILSRRNPYFYEGVSASGIGSPHTPPGYVWHIALAVQGLTGDADEARRCLETILETDGGTGLTHESFDPDDPRRFTRPWFSWSNSMACELMMTLAADGA